MKVIKSKNFSKNNQKGFTLIELLVVISIISLLSTVNLASLNDARRKARNTQVQQEVGEWIKAIELYKADNDGKFPLESQGISSMGHMACLGGNYSICNSSDIHVNDQTVFQNQILKYMNVSQNPNRKPVFIFNQNHYSTYNIGYMGDEENGWDGLHDIQIYWYLENQQQCSFGAYTSPDTPSGNTMCSLQLYYGY